MRCVLAELKTQNQQLKTRQNNRTNKQTKHGGKKGIELQTIGQKIRRKKQKRDALEKSSQNLRLQ